MTTDNLFTRDNENILPIGTRVKFIKDYGIKVKTGDIGTIIESYEDCRIDCHKIELDDSNHRVEILGSILKIVTPLSSDVIKTDTGSHYRFEYRGVKLDPYRIAEIYGMTDFALMTILKKCLCAGNRGHKDLKRDLEDIITAAQRRIEMLEEEINNG